MNELMIFDYNNKKIRTVEKNGEVWWVLKDVCEILELSNSRIVADRLDDDERCKFNLPRQGETWVINESGLYNVILRSDKPEAKPFKKWVTGEVLPSIRKTGTYTTHKQNDDLERERLETSKARADAMLLNAKNRTFKTIMSVVKNKELSPIAVEVFGLKGLESVFGVEVGNYLPKCEATYSATEVGEMLGGVSKNKIGSIANKNNLKTEEYGVVVMDKSPYSSKEIPSFRYNQKGVDKIKEILMCQVVK